MTRKEKIEAFAMRLDGRPFQEIADTYGVTKQYAQQMLYGVCTKGGVVRKKFVYPNICEWMEQHGITQAKLARELGVAQTTISTYMTGTRDPSMKFVQIILEKTGMTFEEAFKKKT